MKLSRLERILKNRLIGNQKHSNDWGLSQILSSITGMKIVGDKSVRHNIRSIYQFESRNGTILLLLQILFTFIK